MHRKALCDPRDHRNPPVALLLPEEVDGGIPRHRIPGLEITPLGYRRYQHPCSLAQSSAQMCYRGLNRNDQVKPRNQCGCFVEIVDRLLPMMNGNAVFACEPAGLLTMVTVLQADEMARCLRKQRQPPLQRYRAQLA